MASSQEKRPDTVIELLRSGKAVFGVFSGEKTPEGARAVAANTEADFVFYDLERGPFDVATMKVFMDSLSGAHPVLTRIPPIRDGRAEARERTRELIDAGVSGVVFPHVETAEEASVAVDSMRGGSSAGVWPLDADGELINFILIEDRIGVENAREIVSTPGVSVVIPGPGDLRRAYDGDAPAIERAIQTVLSACKERGVPCGITAGNEDIEKRLKEGFRVIITGGEALTIGRRAAGR